MLKTIRDFIMLMGGQKKAIVCIARVKFFDDWLIVVPLMTAFHIIARMPEFNPNVTEVLTAQEMIHYSLVMLASILVRIVLSYLVSYFRSGAETMGIFSIFSKMIQQSIDRMNQIKNIPKMHDLMCDDKRAPEELNRFDICFDHVSFCVPEGTTTGLVGLSGSGKTTVTNLVARFWNIMQGPGTISIGGKEIRTLSYENLLKKISFVFQDVFLFNDTVLNNICIGQPDATLRKCKK